MNKEEKSLFQSYRDALEKEGVPLPDLYAISLILTGDEDPLHELNDGQLSMISAQLSYIIEVAVSSQELVEEILRRRREA